MYTLNIWSSVSCVLFLFLHYCKKGAVQDDFKCHLVSDGKAPDLYLYLLSIWFCVLYSTRVKSARLSLVPTLHLVFRIAVLGCTGSVAHCRAVMRMVRPSQCCEYAIFACTRCAEHLQILTTNTSMQCVVHWLNRQTIIELGTAADDIPEHTMLENMRTTHELDILNPALCLKILLSMWAHRKI